MTAPDPRLDEIQARLSAATPGPWAFDGTEIDTVPDPEGDTPWKSIMECRVDCMSYCYGGSVAMDIGADDRALIQSAPDDIAYLLAELRKAHEALARVEALHKPVKIYDECDCTDGTHPDEYDYIDCEDYVGCENSLSGVGCQECCVDSWDSLTQECGENHSHSKDPVFRCDTIKALRAAVAAANGDGQ